MWPLCACGASTSAAQHCLRRLAHAEPQTRHQLLPPLLMPDNTSLPIQQPLLQQFITADEYCHSHSVAHRWVFPKSCSLAVGKTCAHPGRQQSSSARSLVLWRPGNFAMCTAKPLLVRACVVVSFRQLAVKQEESATLCTVQRNCARLVH